MFLDAFFGLGSSMLPLNLLFIVGLLVWGFFCPYSIVHFFNMCVYIYTYKPSSLSCLAQLTLWLYVCHGIILVGSSAPHSGSLTPHPVGQKRTGRVEVQKFMSWDTDSLIIKKEGGGGGKQHTTKRKKNKTKKNKRCKRKQFLTTNPPIPSQTLSNGCPRPPQPSPVLSLSTPSYGGGYSCVPLSISCAPPSLLAKASLGHQKRFGWVFGDFFGSLSNDFGWAWRRVSAGPNSHHFRLAQPLALLHWCFVFTRPTLHQVQLGMCWVLQGHEKVTFFFFFSSLSSFSLFFLFFLWK